MSNTLRIRRAGPPDTSTITAFNKAMARETEGRLLDEVTLEEGVRSLLSQPEYGFYVIAERSDSNGIQPIGQLMITYEWSDWRNGLFWWVQSVYVVPNERQRGVYHAMHGHIAAEAKANPRICGIRLYVARTNQHARAAYQKVGLIPSHYDMYEQDFVLGSQGVTL